VMLQAVSIGNIRGLKEIMSNEILGIEYSDEELNNLIRNKYNIERELRKFGSLIDKYFSNSKKNQIKIGKWIIKIVYNIIRDKEYIKIKKRFNTSIIIYKYRLDCISEVYYDIDDIPIISDIFMNFVNYMKIDSNNISKEYENQDEYIKIMRELND
jgi:hypothetical protein